MRLRLPIISVLLAICLSFFPSSAFAALKAVPVPRAPISQDDFDTDLLTGSAGYNYTLKVPKGTNGLTPEVSLSYNSGAAKGISQRTGMGWDLEHDYIERDVNFTPKDTNTGDDKFKLHFKGQTHDLVFVTSDGRYHTKIESNLHIKKINSGGTNSKGAYWEVTEKDGAKYRFGYQSQSELACSDPGRDYVTKWNLDLVEDAHGNKIFYTYSESNGASFLTKIEYNSEKSRVIDFSYDTQPYQRTVFTQGCKVTEGSRLNNVQIKVNNNFVRKFDLKYVTTTNGGQLLSSFVEKGSTTSALPATKFAYNPQSSAFQSTDAKWLNNVQLDYTDLDRNDTRLIDVNGDALPDIVRSYGASTITYKVWLNTGSTWSTQSQDWMVNNSFDAGLDDNYVELTDVTGDSLPDIVKAASSDGWRVWRNTGSSWSTQEENWGIPSVHSSVNLTSANVRLIDVTGDSLPDVVRSWWNGQREYVVIRNTGSSWNSPEEVWSYNGIPDELSDSDVLITDVNGDSLADLVKTSYSGTYATWSVYLNTGSSWETTPVTWINNANIDAHLEKNNVTLSDINGDGLTDIIKIIDQGTNDKWDVLLNKGNSWSTVWETWVTGVDADVEGEDNVKISDVNGDTYPDIVKSTLNTGGNVTWQVWKNNSNATDLLSSVKTSLGGWIRFEYASTSAMFDNTGSDSLSDLPFGMQVVKKMTVSNGMSGVLATSDVTTYSYQDGLYDWQDKEFRGFAVVDTVEPNTAKKKYVFEQSDALKGLLAEVQTRDSANNPYFETENTWGLSLNSGIYTVNLTEEKQYTYDGTASNPKIVETEYQYDNYGNVTKQSELGDTGITGDERFTYNEYLYNTGQWIVDKLTHTVLKSSDDSTKVSEHWQFYDSDPNATSSASAPPASKFGDGSDGDITISSTTTEAPIDAIVTATSGTNTATVNRTTGFFTNQLVLFHQTQGTNAGAWEIARVASHLGTTLTLTANLTNSYSNSGSNRAQVRVLPQYHNVTVNSGVIWNAKAWDGSTGGILAFLANGTVTVNGTINASGQGFRNGAGASNAAAQQGEGTAGVGGTVTTSANGNGGGGGGGGVWFGGGGGGAGGNGTSGANGGHGGAVGYGGTGGGTAGNADLTTMVFGGAGGGGGSYYGNGQGGAGGKSGGIIFTAAETLTVNSGGSINANGLAGSNSIASGDSGGGGGGAGGSVLIKTQNASLGSSLISSAGGAGGGYNGSGAPGGTGGAGRIRIQYETSLTGITNPAASTSQSTISNVPAGVLTWSANNINLTKGDVTKEVKWLSGGTNPESNYEYDSYGNVTKVTDPNNHATTYTYNLNDTTGTYLERITNAKAQQTNMTYDLGTGNVLSKTDPNGLTTSYEYDLFGRITKEIKPYDTSGYPTTAYTYLVDGIAPEGTLISRREVSSSSAALEIVTLVDGLGKTIQTRQDAEDPTKQIVVDTYYDPTGEIKKETVPYIATASAMTASASGIKFGDGSDGDITISSNTTETPIDSYVTAAVGSTTATVDAGLGFAADQIVLLHQTQGTNAGTWEFARVRSYSGTMLELTSALANSYTSYGNNHAQIRVVRQYHNVTVNSGVTWTAKAWNGTTGGILTFLANGTVSINGAINATGKGFRTTASGYSQGTIGYQGEGTYSAGAISSNAANGSGAGGGGGNIDAGHVEAGHGGGGGNGTVGQTPANRNTSAGGTGGNISGTADFTTMTFGGAGGEGGNGWSSGDGRSGGSGGGIIFITGAAFTVSGTIVSSGHNGTDSNDRGGAGGGGAGGSVLLKTQTATLGSGLVIANGGTGGICNAAFSGSAGNGGNGRIHIEYENSLTGSTTPSADVNQNQISLLPTTFAEYANLDPNAQHTEYTYDAAGRVAIVENPKGDSRTIAYDHWKETTIDENGHIKRQYLNAYGKIAKVEEVIGVTSHATNYQYNTLDLLTQIIDSSSNSATITYDTLGHKVAHDDPDMGTWMYSYDAAGNQTSTTDARNITTTRTYDELNRLTSVLYPNDTDVNFLYDSGKIGTLSVATDSAGTVFYTYDNRLRKTQETRVINGTSKTTEFSYDSLDRVTNQTNPDGTQSNYTFNNQGEIETLDGILSDVDYNALGKITEKSFNNGLTTNYSYNTDDFRLNRIQTGTLQDLNYAYDAVGNITSIFNDITDKTQTFTYDDLDRLKTATESAGFSYAYEYNPIGNLTKFTNSGVDVEYSYGEGAGPHALTGSTASGSAEIEILNTTWNLAGNNGADEADLQIPTDTINGKESVKVTFDLHGTSFGGGDDEASIIFIQGGEWFAANVIQYANNGLNGSQTVDIPLSAFQKVNDTPYLDPEGAVTYLHARFWNSGAFTVDITSVKVVSASSGQGGGGQGQETELMTSSPWNLAGNNGSDGAADAIPANSLNGKEAVKVTFDLHGTTFGGGDDEASVFFVQDGDWRAANVTFFGAQNGYNGSQTVTIPLSAFHKVGDPNVVLDPEGEVADVGVRFWNSGAFTVDVTSIKVLGNVSQITYRSTATAAPDFRTNTTISAPSGIQDNDILIGVLYVESDVTVTAPSGWTLVDSLDHPDQPMDTYVYWKRASSESGSYTWTHDNAPSSGAIVAYSGVVTEGDPFDAYETTNQGNSASLTGTGLTTATDGAMIVLAGGLWGWVNSVSAPSGMTERVDNNVVYIADQLIATAGATGNKTGTIANSDYWSAFVLALTPEPQATSSGSTSGTITYDANGNMLQEGTKCYEYNEANKLKKVKTCGSNQTIAEYVYDYKGKRLVKKNYTSGTLTNTVISWSDSFETKDIGGTIETTNYFYANGELVAKKNPDGSKYYYHNDHLHSSVLMTNQAGGVIEETKFDPWGAVLSGATKSKFLYTGQEHDAETGLHYYDARYYDPELKRFTQPDTYIQDVYNPQSLNRYSYALNNPLRYTDPTGNFSFDSVISFISNIFKPQAPKNAPVASTAKLPNNSAFNQPINRSSGSSGGSSGGGGRSGGGNNTSINVFGVSGGGGSSNQGNNTITHITEDPLTTYFKRGYVDVGGSMGRYVTGGGGVKLNRSGVTQYVSGGLGSEAKLPKSVGFLNGVTVLASPNPVKQNSTGENLTIALGVAAQWNFNRDTGKFELEAMGMGCCGFEFVEEYTGKTSPMYQENRDLIDFRSKDL